MSVWRSSRRSPDGESDRLQEQLRAAHERIDSLEKELQTRAQSAESAAKELDSLTYGISHDLRSPLRAIDGFARILEDDCAEGLGEIGQSHLKVIRDAAGRMDRMLEALTALSRLGRKQLTAVELDMNALARGAADEVCRARGIDPASIVIHPLPGARGDSALLKQVWAHLLDNACKFSGKTNPPRVEITAREEPSGPVYQVKDNGVGFDSRYGDKLFNIFQRLHSEKEFPGVGAGLAIVQRIVSRHGGRVWAEGARDQGACFSFTLFKDEK